MYPLTTAEKALRLVEKEIARQTDVATLETLKRIKTLFEQGEVTNNYKFEEFTVRLGEDSFLVFINYRETNIYKHTK